MLSGKLRLMRKGYVRIRICGGSYERFFNLCANHRILLWDLAPAEKGYEADLYLDDFFKLKPLAGKCRTRIRVCRKTGLPFFLNRHRKRKVFALGLLLCGFFIFFLSCFVWRISVDGNVRISRQVLMEYLAGQNVGYGTWKNSVDCKQLAADLRDHFPVLTWVSVRLQGTCLSVQVQEEIAAQEETPADIACDLVADADGIIVNMITRQGLPVVENGDVVSAGDLLVKGEMPVTDDSGAVVSYRYAAADADVYIRTSIPYEDRFPLAHEVPEYTGRHHYGFYVNLLGRCFGLDLGLGRFEEEDVLGKERQLRLFADFYLPVSAALLETREYVTTVETYTREEAMGIAERKLRKFLAEKEEKGVQIFENNVKIDVTADSCRAAGTLTAVQKTGRRADLQKTDLSQEGTNE